MGFEPLGGVVAQLLLELQQGDAGEEGAATGQQLEQDGGQAVDVAGRGEHAGAQLLGLRVVRRAHDHVVLGGVDPDHRAAVPRSRETKIEHFDLAVALDEDVLGFDVAMHHAHGVGLGQTEARLVDDRDRLRRVKRFAEVVPVVERATAEQVHQQVDVTVGSQAAIEGADDVGVGQRAEDRDLAEGSLRFFARVHGLASELEGEALGVAGRFDFIDASERADAQDTMDLDVARVDVPGLEIERHVQYQWLPAANLPSFLRVGLLSPCLIPRSSFLCLAWPPRSETPGWLRSAWSPPTWTEP